MPFLILLLIVLIPFTPFLCALVAQEDERIAANKAAECDAWRYRLQHAVDHDDHKIWEDRPYGCAPTKSSGDNGPKAVEAR